MAVSSEESIPLANLIWTSWHGTLGTYGSDNLIDTTYSNLNGKN
jgi:hypothetical protein